MANFNYRIITKEGKEKSGSLESDDQITAVAQLKSEGNTVISVKEGSKLNTEIKLGRGKKVKVRDLSAFCRQFNSLLKAGVGVITALDMLGDQTENRTLKQSIYNVRDGVQKGDTLANSMKKEDCFPSLLVSMMEAGEQSGNIEIALERMAEHFEKDGRAKAALKKAMMYPIILGIVAIAVLVIMVVAVIPSFSSMFADMYAKLPGITRGRPRPVYISLQDLRSGCRHSVILRRRRRQQDSQELSAQCFLPVCQWLKLLILRQEPWITSYSRTL